jgi:hypothetical protein
LKTTGVSVLKHLQGTIAELDPPRDMTQLPCEDGHGRGK